MCILNVLSRFMRFFGFGFVDYDLEPKINKKLRIGILSTAKISKQSLINPSKFNRNIEIVAIASRKSGSKYVSYDELLMDPKIDAIYIPLPNGLHYKWALKALENNKHVLLEKPFVSNYDSAERLINASKRCGKIVLEAMHSIYHPSIKFVKELIDNGHIENIISINATFHSRIYKDDIRFNKNGSDKLLSGGSLMDNGVYCIYVILYILGLDFDKVVYAKAKTCFDVVDSQMDAIISFKGSDIRAVISSSFNAIYPADFVPKLVIKGSEDSIIFYNFVLPSLWHSIKIDSRKYGSRQETRYGPSQETSYEYQLEYFYNAVVNLNDFYNVGFYNELSLKVLKIIDEIYIKSGIGPRIGYD